MAIKLTYPQVALVFDVVLFNSQLLGFQESFLYSCGSFFEDETKLLNGFVDAHPSDETGNIPHLFRAVSDVGLHVTYKLKNHLLNLVN